MIQPVLSSVKNENAREFYETEALRSGWSVRQLDRQIGSQFYERVALSKNKAAMLQKAGSSETTESKPEQAIRDPFVLEFLDLKDEYSESDLEEALIQNLSDFLLELGDDFAFIGRQRRLRIDNNWFRIDLVFYHRQLKSLSIIELLRTSGSERVRSEQSGRSTRTDLDLGGLTSLACIS